MLLTDSTSPSAIAVSNVFEALPWQVAPWHDTSPVLLLTGSAGGGKSRLMYEKAHAFCLRYPGANVVALRKTFEDCKRSILPTLDDYVIGDDKSIVKNKSERHYLYSNGSRLWWAGMRTDKERKALRSMGSGGSLDMILMEEGVEFTEVDFDEVQGRMRGRAAPWNQVIIATNPDAPGHWINRRLIIGGGASVHISSAADNSHLDDNYLVKLDEMSGLMRARMAMGLWVEGTGLVIDRWSNKFNVGSGSDRGGNVSLTADYIPGGGRVVMAADDGYTGEWDERAQMFTDASHPRVFLLAQIRPTGQLCVFAESYKIKTLYSKHLDDLREMCMDNGWPMPQEVHYDKSSAALEGELRSYGFGTLYRSTSQREESIKFLNERIAADENGFRHVLVHPRCRLLIMEMSSWSYIDGTPSKINDHGPDALRYMVWNLYRGVAINGAVGLPSVEQSVADRIDRKMSEIDRVMDALDAKWGASAF